MKRWLIAAALALATAVPLLPAVGAAPAAAVSCTVTTRLTPSTSNSQVLCLEQRLVELGYGGLSPDTFYDGASVNAVRSFQISRGLYPDGIITSVTGRQLGLRGPTPDPDIAGRVTVIGDSTSAAMRWYDEAANVTTRYDVAGTTYDVIWSVESCRRLVAPSCTGRTDPGTGAKWVPVSVLPLMQTTLKGRLGQTLVIMAGYDDVSISSAINQIMTEANAQGVSKVFWLNYRLTNAYSSTYQYYYPTHNTNLEAAKVRWPNLVVLDWNGYSYSQPLATQRAWFASDEIHLTGVGALALANYIKFHLDLHSPARCAAAAGGGAPDPGIGAPATPASSDTGFVAVDPVRAFDSRDPAHGGMGPIRAGRVLDVDLSGMLPAGTQAAVLNVTAVDPCGEGYLSVFACGARPLTSNVNYVAARTTAALVITPHSSGRVCVYSHATSDIIVDVVGAFVPNGARFHHLDPTRWVDTRGNPAQVSVGGPLSPRTQIDVPIAGVGAVPGDATAVWVNLTATGSPADAVLQVYPGPCAALPQTSTVNVMANRDAATSAIVEVGPNGGICVSAYAGRPHVVLDLSGWFSEAADGLVFRVETPSRAFDTRSPQGTPVSSAVVLHTASAVSVFNVAAVENVGFGWVAVKPCGSANTSSLVNAATREPVANLGVVAPGTNGQVCFSRLLANHLVVDLAGTFVPPTPG